MLCGFQNKSLQCHQTWLSYCDVYTIPFIVIYNFNISTSLFCVSTYLHSACPQTPTPHTPPTANLSTMHLSRPWSGPGLEDKWSEWGTAVYKELIGTSLKADVKDHWRLILRWLKRQRCSRTCSSVCAHNCEDFTHEYVCTNMRKLFICTRNRLKYRSVFRFGSYDALWQGFIFINLMVDICGSW